MNRCSQFGAGRFLARQQPFPPSGRFLLAAILSLATLGLFHGRSSLATPLAPNSEVVFAYSNLFTAPIGTEWSRQQAGLTPAGARPFLGPFGNETVRLTLSNLPPHTAALVDFDLFVILTWDGNWVGPGPDVWSWGISNGPTLLTTTFNNGHPASFAYGQAYPGSFPGDTYPYRTGAAENDTLGFGMDSVYRISSSFVSTNGTLTINFSGSGLQNIEDESWGLANFRLTLLDAPSGTIALSKPLQIVSEGAAQAVVHVQRIGGNATVTSVNYSTSGGAADRKSVV